MLNSRTVGNNNLDAPLASPLEASLIGAIGLQIAPYFLPMIPRCVEVTGLPREMTEEEREVSRGFAAGVVVGLGGLVAQVATYSYLSEHASPLILTIPVATNLASLITNLGSLIYYAVRNNS